MPFYRRKYTRKPFRKVRKYGVYRRKKPFYYRRKQPYRARALRKVQNLVRFTSKVFYPYLAYWKDTTSVTGTTDDFQTFQRGIQFGDFFTGNDQLKRNLSEYHWIKFNYFAIQFCDISYLGYTSTEKTSDGLLPSGVTAVQMDNHPMFFNWDIEEDMSFTKTDTNTITGSQLVQHPGTKSVKPSDKKNKVCFVYRVPSPWRQFYSTYNVKNSPSGNSLGAFFEDVSGIKNLRAPKLWLAAYPNYWGAQLPINPANNSVKILTHFSIKLYMGVTFRGRNIVGNPTVYAPMSSNLNSEESSENEEITENSINEQIIN